MKRKDTQTSKTVEYSSFEKKVMRRLILLAEKKKGLTYPNPVVSAAVVIGETIISEGVHSGVGMAHAEVLALDSAGVKARGATLFITLEPCSHWGHTPPCVDSILKRE